MSVEGVNVPYLVNTTVNTTTNNNSTTNNIYNSGVFGSFFMDAPYTGRAIAEYFVPNAFVFTGYSLACITTGSGTFPLSGTIYQRGTGNGTGVLAAFTFANATFFKTSGGFSVNITGQNRLGFDIVNNLSGVQSFTIGVFGSG